MYAGLTFLMLFLVFCVQEFLPRLGPGASYSMIMLYPVWFFCTAVTLPYPVMLLMAFVGGLMWDLRHTVHFGAGIGAFGMGVMLFGLLGNLMHGVRPLYRKGHMGMPILLAGVCVFLFRAIDYLFLNFKRGGLEFPRVLVWEFCSTALLSMAISPLIYFLLHWLNKTLEFHMRFQTIGR